MPHLLPDIRQVHGIDPVRHPARAPQVLPLDPGRHLTRFLLPGLVDRPDHQVPAAPLALPRRLFQPGHREPAHHPHRREGIPPRVIQQPLRLIRRPVPRLPGHAPPVHPPQLADQRPGVLARPQPRLGPGKARPQQIQQLSPLPRCQAHAYPDGSSRLRFCCLHTHLIARRLPFMPEITHPPFPQVTTASAAAVLGGDDRSALPKATTRRRRTASGRAQSPSPRAP